MKIAIQTLGCKVNQYETQGLCLLLEERGHDIVPFDCEADAYIVNSCTVTAMSDRKSRQTLSQAKKRKPDAIFALCGCYPQVSPKETKTLGVDVLAGTGDRRGFVDLLEEAYRKKCPQIALDDAFSRQTFEALPSGSLSGRTRAMLKVEDGCVNFCSYCIIPYARGKIRSLPLEDAVAESRRLAGMGYRELVLTGIEISSWGRDLPRGETTTDLICAICEAVPHCRLRLGSLEPRTVTEDFCQRLSQYTNLCPHFHLSMQSGCDATLQRMNRKYDTARYAQSVALLRQYFPHVGITTDLIVGFPQETEAEFLQTLAFVEACAFSDLHIFPYSLRQGTPAARMDGQLTRQEKASRASRAEAVAKTLRAADRKQRLGTEALVLFEEEKDGVWRGHAGAYVDCQTESERDLQNVLCRVSIQSLASNGRLNVTIEEVIEQ